MDTQKSKYDNKDKCCQCGGENDLSNFTTDGGHVSECDCKCTKCGFEVYWSYGFFNIEPPESEMHLHAYKLEIPEIPKINKPKNTIKGNTYDYYTSIFRKLFNPIMFISFIAVISILLN